MKQIILLILRLFFWSHGYSQTNFSDNYKYKAAYKLTFQLDSTDVNSIATEEMWLYLGNKFSKFSSRGKALEDSLQAEDKKSSAMYDFKARAELTKTEFDYNIFKNLPENKISYATKISKDRLRYEENRNLLEWEILPGKKIIQGYESQQAKVNFKGRNYTAWFTSELPISDGPYKFHGLPGLILELRDSRDHYIFELIEFKNLRKPIPVKFDPEAYTLMSRKLLLQQKREFEEDPLSGIERRNPRVTITVDKAEKKQYLREIQKKLEKKNNPI